MKKNSVGRPGFRVVEDFILEQGEKYGAIERLDLLRDRDTGQSHGFAFVEMSDGMAAHGAISELNRALLGSQAVNVNEAPETRDREFRWVSSSGRRACAAVTGAALIRPPAKRWTT